jgi:hypothetical protein
VLPEPLPAPIETTAEDLRGITHGMQREEVLKAAPPSVRITMFEDGKLVEVYRYMAGERNLGVVRLSNGAVASVNVLP